MRLILHREVYSDVNTIMDYYARVSARELANEFYAELRQSMLKAAKHPELFSHREHGIRRANLRRFTYHFLFRAVGDEVRVLVVRHHRRHPSYGVSRQ